MNRNILKAQVWELWRLTRMELLVRFLMPFPAFWLYTKLPTASSIVFVFILIASLSSLLWIKSLASNRHSDGFLFNLSYARPVGAAAMVLVPLVWHVLTSLALYVTSLGLASLLLGLKFHALPTLPAVFFSATALACTAWCTPNLIERTAGVCLAIGATAWWFGPDLILLDPLVLSDGRWDNVFETGQGEQLALLTGTGGLVALCIHLVGRQRSGEMSSAFRWREVAEQRDVTLFDRGRAFPTARRAQIWFELRRAGRRALLMTGLGGAVMASSAAIVSTTDQTSVFALLWSTSLCLTPLALLIVNIESVLGLKYRGHTASLSLFEATRPASVGGDILLKAAISSGLTLAGCSVLGVMALACTALLAGSHWDEVTINMIHALEYPFGEVALWMVAGVVGIVAAVALCITATLLTMSIGYFGPLQEEHGTAFYLVVAGIVLPFLISIVGNFVGWDLAWLVHLTLMLWGVLLMGFAVKSLWRCGREGYLGVPLLVLAILSWTGLVGTAWFLLVQFSVEIPPMAPSGLVLVAGLLCVPPASLAWAPLSLAALRSR